MIVNIPYKLKQNLPPHIPPIHEPKDRMKVFHIKHIRSINLEPEAKSRNGEPNIWRGLQKLNAGIQF